MANEQIKKTIEEDYKYGFETKIDQDTFAPGLDENTVRKISNIKDEPDWLLKWRLHAFGQWLKIKEYLTNNDKVISFSILNLSNKKATINVNLISENLFLDDLTKNSYNVKKKSDNLLILNIE